MRFFIIAAVLGAAAVPAPAAPAEAAGYVPPDVIRAELATLPPDPFLYSRPGDADVPATPARPVPANRPWLALARGYVIATEPGPSPFLPLRLQPPNPFSGESEPLSPPPLSVPATVTGNWNQFWAVTWDVDAWNAVTSAWERDPVAIRRRFRTASGMDWPVAGATGPRSDAVLLAVSRWARTEWSEAVRRQAAHTRQRLGIRGPLVALAPWDAPLSVLSPGDAANHPGPVLRPRITQDAWTNRYGLGFQVRLATDLSNHVPLPTLDFSGLDAFGAPWARFWLDEVVRNGVTGVAVRLPAQVAARTEVRDALAPLATANVFLPPPTEVAILVSRDTAAVEPGAWISLFRTYAGLRQAGVWPHFVSEEQIAGGTASLARFRVLVVPAARWGTAVTLEAIRDWAARGGILVITDPEAFSRAADGRDTGPAARAFLGWKGTRPREDAGLERGDFVVVPLPSARVRAAFQDGTPAILERRLEAGRLISSPIALTDPDGAWDPFWKGLARDAKVPDRTWLESVTAANVAVISGKTTRGRGDPETR